jgi:hypothetical protein
MHGDALGTETLAFDRCKSYIGNIAAAGIPQRGNFVDINA